MRDGGKVDGESSASSHIGRAAPPGSPAAIRAAREAVARGLAFLESVQLRSGEFPVYASTDPTLAEGCAADPSVFPTTLVAHSLADCAQAGPLRQRALAFLAAEMDPHGLWRHWTREHPHCSQLPPDLTIPAARRRPWRTRGGSPATGRYCLATAAATASS
jgi:hypothetical protein